MVPALLLLLVPATALESVVSPPPNILLLVADDLGWADVPWRDPAVPAPEGPPCAGLVGSLAGFCEVPPS